MHRKLVKRSLYYLCLVLLAALAGCGGMGFSPEQMAVRQAVESGPPDGIVDTETIQVLQTVEMNGKIFVMVSFNETVKNRKDECLFVYGFERSPLCAWVTSSGGGGCSGQVGGDPAPAQPISQIGLNMSSGGGKPTDPGYSSIRGLVNSDVIVTVRITWKDNTVQEVEVINGSFLAVRAGQVDWIDVEGLNQNGAVVYDHQSPSAAPGKH